MEELLRLHWMKKNQVALQCLTILALLFAGGNALLGQCLEYAETRIEFPMSGGHAFFGQSIDIQGDVMVVGAHVENYPGFVDAGGAYIYRYTAGSWDLEQVLTASPIESTGFFGAAVAIDGDRVIVSAEGEDYLSTNSGAVYSYQYDSGSGQWSQDGKIAVNGVSLFGGAVDLFGDRLLVGSADAERAWVYRWDGASWLLEQELVPSGPKAALGFAVSMSSSHAAVGAFGSDRVYLFERQGTSWVQAVELSDSSVGAYGHSLSLREDLILVSSNGGDSFLHRQVDGIWDPSPEIFDSVGGSTVASAVDANGELVVLGQNGLDRLLVYRREMGTWFLDRVLQGSGGTFGRPSVMDGSRFVVGAPREISERGAVYVFEPTFSPPFTISSHPQSVEACEGGPASFQVLVDPVDPSTVIEYAWQLNGVDLAGQSGSTLLIPVARQTGEGSSVRVRISGDGCSLLSDEASILFVAPPDPTSAMAMPPFACFPLQPILLSAVPPPNCEIDWFEDGCGDTPIGIGDSIQVQPAETTTYYARSRSTVFPFCVGENCANIEVALGSSIDPPIFLSTSFDGPVCPGTPVELEAASAVGVIEWRDNNCEGPAIAVGATLSVSPLSTTTYFASAVDGSCESPCIAMHTIEVTTVPPPFVSSTASAICIGDSILLSAIGTGGVLEWREGDCRSGSLVATGVDSLLVTPNTTTTYWVSELDDSGTGCYSDCESITVVVDFGPVFTSQPEDTVFCREASFDLSVMVTTPFLESYQWTKDGIPLVDGMVASGATIMGSQSATLTVANAGDPEQGEYTVVVTNPCGAVTSSDAVATRIPFVESRLLDGAPTTTGGAMVTCFGGGLDDVDQCWVRTPHGEVEVFDFAASIDGAELDVVLPPLAPGCDCAEASEFAIDLVLSGPCGVIPLIEEGLPPIDVLIEVIEVLTDLQAALDAAVPGTCLRLTSTEAYQGPFELTNGDRITVTGEPADPEQAIPLVIRLQGESVSGARPVFPTLRLVNSTDTVCVANVVITHGNSGVEFDGGEGRLVRCQITKNEEADLQRGGGVSILNGAAPLLFKCDVLGNRTQGIGGGVLIRDSVGTLLDCTLSANSAGMFGAGLAVDLAIGDVRVIDCVIEGHIGSELGPEVETGGGIYWVNGDFMVGDEPSGGLLLRNAIRGNQATHLGAGIYFGRGVRPDVISNEIVSNSGTFELSRGGGFYVEDNNQETFLFCENIVHDNQAQVGGGIRWGEKNEIVAQNNFVFCNRAVQLAPPPKIGEPVVPFFAAGILSRGSEVLFDHNTVFENTGANISPQSGGFHHEGAAVFPFSIRNNAFFDNSGFEVYSVISFPIGHFAYNLGYDVSGLGQIFSVCGSGCEVASLLEDPLIDGDCFPLDPWTEFSPAAGSPALGSALSGFDRGAIPDSSFVPGNCVVFEDDIDSDGTPDEIQIWAELLLDLDLDGEFDLPTGASFTRGDCNVDGSNNIADGIFLLGFLFSGGAFPECDDACDANDDGTLNIGDAIAILGSLFGSPTVPLVAPTSCGGDPTMDDLNCSSSDCP